MVQYSNPNYNLNLMEAMAHYYQNTHKLILNTQQKLLDGKDSTQRLFNNQMLIEPSEVEEQRRLNERILIQQEEKVLLTSLETSY